MPVKGLNRSQLLALGAMVLYQQEHHLPVGIGIKAFCRWLDL
jgi:hypothetical protein